MISIAYVNGIHEQMPTVDAFVRIENTISEIMQESSSAYDNYMNKYNQFITEFAILGNEASISESELFTESTNVFEKIGESIIKIAEKIKEFICNLVDRIRGFYKKSDLEKISEAAKKNPVIADDLIAAFKEGKLSVYDAKTIKDIEASYMELIKHAKAPNVSPDSFAGKVKEFKNKCENSDKSAMVTVAKSVGAVVSTASAILLIRKIFTDTSKSSAEANIANEKVMDATVKALQEMSKSSDPNVVKAASGELGKAKMLQEVSEWTGMKFLNAAQKNNETATKISDSIKKVIAKIDKSGKIIGAINKKDDAKLQKDINAGKALRKLADDKTNATKVDRDAERRKNREDAADKAYGSEKGKHDFEGKHYQSVVGRKADASYQTKYAQNNGDAEWFNGHINEYLNRKEAEAKAQAAGREQGSSKPAKRDIKKDAKLDELGRIEARQEAEKKSNNKK